MSESQKHPWTYIGGVQLRHSKGLLQDDTERTLGPPCSTLFPVTSTYPLNVTDGYLAPAPSMPSLCTCAVGS